MTEQAAADWPEGGPLAVAMGRVQAQGDAGQMPDDQAQNRDQEAPRGDGRQGDDRQPEGVLTKDGKHLIPFDVLEEARQRAAEERQRADRLEAELAAQRQGVTETPQPQATPDTPEAQLVSRWGVQRETLTRLLEEARSDGDEQLTAAYQAQIEQGDELMALRTGMAELRQTVTEGVERQRQREQQSEEEQITAAVATSPLLVAWAEDRDHPMWHQVAVGLNSQLLQDPNSDYARMTWEQRFAELPRLVEEHLGVPSPHRRALPDQAPHRQDRVPYSISAIPGAQPVAAGLPSGPADTAGMSRQEQTKYMVGLYSDGRLFNNLRDFPIGSLNTGGRHDA